MTDTQPTAVDPTTPELLKRIEDLERDFASHVNATNNPHQTTAKASGAVAVMHYKSYIQTSLNESITMLAGLKSIRAIMVGLAVLIFIGAFNTDVSAVRMLLALGGVTVGCIGVLVSTLVIAQSRHQRHLRQHLNDITR